MSLTESGHTPAGMFSVVGVGISWGFYADWNGPGCKKGGIPSHGFGESPFWGDFRKTGVDLRVKMYANGCYWRADQRLDDLWVVAIGKLVSKQLNYYT